MFRATAIQRIVLTLFLTLMLFGCGDKVFNFYDEPDEPPIEDGDPPDNGEDTDGDQPEVDGDKPATDGDESDVDGDNIIIDGDDPAEDGDDPAEDGDDPAEDGDDPIVDGDDPIVDGDDPIVDGDDPIVDGDDPIVDGDDPIVDGDDPIVDGDDPIVDGDDPIEDGDDPIEDGDEPIEDGDEEIVDGDDPIVDGDEPVEDNPLKLTVTDLGSAHVGIAWNSELQIDNAKIFIAAEPSGCDCRELPGQIEITTVNGSTNTANIPNLAPGVDVFIRVEASSGATDLAANIHARTLGGPRAELSTPTRSVNMVADDIMMVTMDNGDGSTWQNGLWIVKRQNGNHINVVDTYRQSVPVGAPEYYVGYGINYSDEIIDVDHRIFLVLSEPIGSREILEIVGPEGVQFTLPFSDKYLETPMIQLNQVGYNPRATKRYAYVYSYMGDGGILSYNEMPHKASVLKETENSILNPRGEILSNLDVSLRSDNDVDAGGAVAEIDLADLPQDEEARYRVHLPGVGVSYQTSVSEAAVFRSYYLITRGLFHNRWHGDLREDCTEWSRPPDHPVVYTSDNMDFNSMHDENTPKTGERFLKGGYHDAGDFDQRPMHTIVPMLLLSSYELESKRFADNQLTIPESGNGIPDLLDEALWGVAAWEQLQEANGGVRMGVESHRHPYGYYLAHTDPLPYWTYGVDHAITTRMAGIFAQASRLVQPFDANRANVLKERAIKAYNFASTFNFPQSYMLYGAGELYRLTGEQKYKTAFETAWEHIGPYGAFSHMALEYQVTPNNYESAMTNPDDAFAKADFIMAYLSMPDAREDIKNLSKVEFVRSVNNMVNNLDKHAHRSPRRTGTPITWGKAATMGTYVEASVAAMRLGLLDENQWQEAFDMMSLSADYMLGGNPLGMVYFTGMGSRMVEEPVHLDSLAFIKLGKGTVPGIPVMGPVDGQPQQPWLLVTVGKFYPSMDNHPLCLRYCDVRTVIVNNEATVWGDFAPNIKLFSALIEANHMPPASWLPGGSKHTSTTF